MNEFLNRGHSMSPTCYLGRDFPYAFWWNPYWLDETDPLLPLFLFAKVSSEHHKKKGTVGQDHYLLLVKACTESPVCYWGVVCGPLVWPTWLPGVVRPLLPPRPPLRSIPLRAELHFLYLPAPPHSCLLSDHQDAKGRDILYHYLHRIPKIESELGRR